MDSEAGFHSWEDASTSTTNYCKTMTDYSWRAMFAIEISELELS